MERALLQEMASSSVPELAVIAGSPSPQDSHLVPASLLPSPQSALAAVESAGSGPAAAGASIAAFDALDTNGDGTQRPRPMRLRARAASCLLACSPNRLLCPSGVIDRAEFDAGFALAVHDHQSKPHSAGQQASHQQQPSQQRTDSIQGAGRRTSAQSVSPPSSSGSPQLTGRSWEGAESSAGPYSNRSVTGMDPDQRRQALRQVFGSTALSLTAATATAVWHTAEHCHCCLVHCLHSCCRLAHC